MDILGKISYYKHKADTKQHHSGKLCFTGLIFNAKVQSESIHSANVSLTSFNGIQ